MLVLKSLFKLIKLMGSPFTNLQLLISVGIIIHTVFPCDASILVVMVGFYLLEKKTYA